MTDLSLVVKSLLSIVPSAILALASSQYLLSQKNDTRRARAAVVILDSDRNKDGLRGPVRRVRIEVVKAGTGRRSLLEQTVYDTAGRRVENLTYPIIIGSPLGEESYEYDASGQLVSTIVRDARGRILSETSYAYEFDSAGNWVKMTALYVDGPPGKEEIREGEITYRSIDYYPHLKAAIDNKRTVSTSPVSSLAQNAPASPAADKVGAKAGGQHTSIVGTQPASVLEFGVINDRALRLPRPSYPVGERPRATPIAITVEVLIDETGRVISARASEAPARLRQAAEASARRAVFLPFRVAGKPVKARGLLSYSFRFDPR